MEEKRGKGRPVERPTKTKTFRIDSEYLAIAEQMFGRKLNRLINDFIKKVTKPKIKA